MTFAWVGQLAQVSRFFEEALDTMPCLPMLADMALYLEWDYSIERSAQAVCAALGKLVAAGVLPALRQACPSPN